MKVATQSCRHTRVGLDTKSLMWGYRPDARRGRSAFKVGHEIVGSCFRPEELSCYHPHLWTWPPFIANQMRAVFFERISCGHYHRPDLHKIVSVVLQIDLHLLICLRHDFKQWPFHVVWFPLGCFVKMKKKKTTTTSARPIIRLFQRSIYVLIRFGKSPDHHHIRAAEQILGSTTYHDFLLNNVIDV